MAYESHETAVMWRQIFLLLLSHRLRSCDGWECHGQLALQRCGLAKSLNINPSKKIRQYLT